MSNRGRNRLISGQLQNAEKAAGVDNRTELGRKNAPSGQKKCRTYAEREKSSSAVDSISPELNEITDPWDELPAVIKKGILAMVRTRLSYSDVLDIGGMVATIKYQTRLVYCGFVMDYQDHISKDPNICHRKPVIKGTPVLVCDILGPLCAGESPEKIHASYSNISEVDISAAAGFAGRHS